VPLNRKQAAQLKQLGANIRRARIIRGITQEKLAEWVELNPRTVQKIEAGNVNILVTTLARFRKALRCPWDKLMGKI
jgi:transcriptional regulator with XRE-family HTH domain